MSVGARVTYYQTVAHQPSRVQSGSRSEKVDQITHHRSSKSENSGHVHGKVMLFILVGKTERNFHYRLRLLLFFLNLLFNNVLLYSG